MSTNAVFLHAVFLFNDYNLHLIHIRDCFKRFRRCREARNKITDEMNGDMVVSKFHFQFCDCVLFKTNALRMGMNCLIPPSYGLKRTSYMFLPE